MVHNVDTSHDLMHRYVVRIARVDDDRRVVLGMVYEPDTLDTYGEFMFADDIETMAHRFAQLWSETIDTNHDNIPNGSFPVESFVARAGDPDFPEAAWVLGIKVPDDRLWRQIKSGELNGFSFEALVKPVPVMASIANVRDRVGRTEDASGKEDHSHVFFAQVNAIGRVERGLTSVDGEHTHAIRKASYTEPGGTDKHTHRFFM